MREYLLTGAVVAAVCYLVTPFVRRFAAHVGAYTPVRDRDVHTIPTPRLGGVAMFLGIGVGLLIASRLPTLQRVFQTKPKAWQVNLDAVKSWSRWHARPIWIGEFGSYDKADYAARQRYTRFVREAIEARGFPWAYWDFASHFGIYDPVGRTWRAELKDALIR